VGKRFWQGEKSVRSRVWSSNGRHRLSRADIGLGKRGVHTIKHLLEGGGQGRTGKDCVTSKKEKRVACLSSTGKGMGLRQKKKKTVQIKRISFYYCMKKKGKKGAIEMALRCRASKKKKGEPLHLLYIAKRLLSPIEGR